MIWLLNIFEYLININFQNHRIYMQTNYGIYPYLHLHTHIKLAGY